MYAKSATENKTSTSSLPSINQVHGTLIVTNKVINEGGGNKKPSDFTINIHANDPVPSSFPGNSSGTAYNYTWECIALLKQSNQVTT